MILDLPVGVLVDNPLRILETYRLHVNARTGYVHVWHLLEKRAGYLHREVVSAPKGLTVDHINGNKLDNRRVNLRLASQSENLQNRHGLAASNTSSARGVSWDKTHSKWMAFAKLNGKFKNLGLFEKKEDAAAAASEWRRVNMPFSEMDQVAV